MKARSDGEEVALGTASALTRTIQRVEATGPRLRAMEAARLEAAIVRAASMLADERSPLGKQARETLPARAELSAEGVRWALETSLEVLDAASLSFARTALEGATLGAARVPVRVAGLVLAGNVFSAALRPIAWALLCRAPVVCKVATTDAGLCELFALALTLADEEVGAAVGVVHFSRAEPALLSRLASGVDALSVHGSDRTIEDARARCPATTELVAHGHGLGVALVPKEALSADVDPSPLVHALALDVAAYDQRGCLSPHAVLVERGGALSGRELARRLSDEGLRALSRSMPRAALGAEGGALQVRWRGVAQAVGELFEGDGWSVSFEGDGPLRACPLQRNVAVHEVASVEGALGRLTGYGAHLKALGVAGPPEIRAAVAARLPPGSAPRVCAPGHMQRPPLGAATDGVPPWQGLVRLASRA